MHSHRTAVHGLRLISLMPCRSSLTSRTTVSGSAPDSASSNPVCTTNPKHAQQKRSAEERIVVSRPGMHFSGSAGLKYTQIAAPGGSYRDQYGGVASYGDMHGQVLFSACCSVLYVQTSARAVSPVAVWF